MDNSKKWLCSREHFVVKSDPSVNSSQKSPLIDQQCCCECGDSLDGSFVNVCTCKSWGKGAHVGYNCPPKTPIISNPEPTNKNVDKIPKLEKVCKYQKFLVNAKNVVAMNMMEFVFIVRIRRKKKRSGIAEDKRLKAYWKFLSDDDDDEDYTIAITPVLSTEEPVNSLSLWRHEHLDTISQRNQRIHKV
ncbi:hypothetical protein Tco_0439411 [Tanacetum coccineum]